MLLGGLVSFVSASAGGKSLRRSRRTIDLQHCRAFVLWYELNSVNRKLSWFSVIEAMVSVVEDKILGVVR